MNCFLKPISLSLVLASNFKLFLFIDKACNLAELCHSLTSDRKYNDVLNGKFSLIHRSTISISLIVLTILMPVLNW